MLHALNSKPPWLEKLGACLAYTILRGPFADLSRIFRGFSGKNSETEWVFQKALQPFSPLSMHIHCEAFPNVHRQSMSTGTREYLQYQGDFVKRFAQIGWVI